MSLGQVPDPLPALLAALVADAATVARTTADRITGETLPPMPEEVQEDQPADAVVLLPAGGGEDEQAPVGYPRVELRAYSKTRTDARALWYIARRALAKRQFVVGGVCVQVGAASGPYPGWEPQVQYPYYTGMLPVVTLRVSA